jgi:hypothetical protein
MTNNPCDLVQIKYKGDGIQKLFTFPFTYLDQGDVFISLWDDTTKDYVDVASTEWTFANATTIEFLNPPPAPPPVVDPLDPPVFNIRIYRFTDVTQTGATFYPGSAIRAEDLNGNFDQLRLAIEEGRCLIPQSMYRYLRDNYWNKTDETIHLSEQKTGKWVADDKHIATAAAISERLDSFVQDTKPANPPITETRQPGKIWFDDGTLQFSYWEPAARAWVNLASTGPVGPSGTVAVGTTTQLPHDQSPTVGNTGTAQSAVLNFGIPKGKPQSVIVRDAVPADNYGAALVAGDLWFNTSKVQLYAWYDDGTSKQWVSISQVGPKGDQGIQGIQGIKGDKGDAQKVAMSATPPATPVAGDLWFNTNKSVLYAFYNDGTSSQWVSI